MTDASTVLNVARTHLTAADIGLENAAGADPRRRLAGVFNVAVSGRAATGALRHLRSIVGKEQFEEWWAPHSATLSGDPVAQYFFELRNDVEHKLPAELTSTTIIRDKSFAELQASMGAPPPGAIGQFWGDPLGGSGWRVQMPDGSEGLVYVDLPLDPDVAVTAHMPGPMRDTPIDELCRSYIAIVRTIIEDAGQRFGP